MSIKTLRKRIALVAATALGAGLISVVSVPSANATAGDIDYVGAAITAPTGVCAVYDSAAVGYALTTATTVGELATPLTVTVAVGGSFQIDVEDTFFTYNSGGAITVTNADTAPVLQPSYGVWRAIDNDTVTVTANAVGTVTVKSYATDPFGTLDTFANPTQSGSMTISVVASCTSAATMSTTYSAWQVTGATRLTSSPSLTAGDTLTFGAGDDAYVSMSLKNGYNANLATTTLVAASATNGAKVKLSTSQTLDDDTTEAGTLSAVSEPVSGANMYLRITPATLGAALTTVVTVTVGGVSAFTRTITFLPEATKMVVVANLVGLVGGEGSFAYQLQAADGTPVPGAVSVRPLTLSERISSVTRIKSSTIVASDISPAAETINSVDAGEVWGTTSSSTSANGVVKFSCQTSAGGGSSKVTMRHTTPVNTAYIDTEITLNCAGGLDTYTVALDKASYNIGEIATLTISAKDSKGLAVNDFTKLNSSTAPDVTMGGSTITKATSTSDGFLGGVKTYKFQVEKAGSFNAVVNLPGTTTKSVTASFKSVDAAAGVTNAEVLAAIVKLIASINAQIKALQKSLKKK
jgi:hypothetical protein